MITRVLFITRNIEFAVPMKAALERTGAFEIHPFTQPESALDYLRENPHEAALVDFTLPDIRIDQIVLRLRAAAPEIAIIAIPQQPEEVVRLLKLQNSVDVPFSGRIIMPILDKAVIDAKKLLAIRTPAPPNSVPEGEPRPVIQPLKGLLKPAQTVGEDTPIMASDDPAAAWQRKGDLEALDREGFDAVLNAIEPNAPVSDSNPPQQGDFDALVNSMRADQPREPFPARHQQFVDFIVKGAMNPLVEQIEQKRASQEVAPPLRSDDDSRKLFRKLADEEPPMPSFEPDATALESTGTISDLFTGVNESSFRGVLSILRGDEPGDDAPDLHRSDFYNAVSSAYDAEQPPPSDWDAPPIDISEAATLFEAGTSSDAHDDSDDDYLRPAAMYDFDALDGASDSEARTDSPARLILEETLNEGKWLDSFSLEALIASIERRLPANKPRVQPLPSWIQAKALQDEALDPQERERNARVRLPASDLDHTEPDFLQDLTVEPPDSLPEVPPIGGSDAMSLSDQFAEQATQLSAGQRIDIDAQNMDTLWSEVPPRKRATPPSAPDTPPMPDSLPETIDAHVDAWDDSAESWDDAVTLGDVFSDAVSIEVTADGYTLPRFSTEEFNTEFERLAAFDFAVRQHPELAADAPVQDPYLAQLALSLTQVSLELTADATLLTRDGETGAVLVAYAGRMQPEDIDELNRTIADDWNVNPEEARIRFITLQGSGKDYMLYSRRTVDTLILSLVFGGSTPLRDIRAQGRRLVEALEVIPEPAVSSDVMSVQRMDVSAVTIEREPVASIADMLEPPPDLGPFSAYAWVWVLRNADVSMDESVIRAITTGMNLQLREQFWRIQALEPHDDYVYLLADIPGEQPPFQIIRDLKRRSADIAHNQDPALPESLWADSYLVVAPGRPLEVEEIQQFINFERMV